MKRQVTSKNYFLSLALVSYMQPVVLTVFSGVVYFLVSAGRFAEQQNPVEIFRFAVPAVFISTTAAGYFVFRNLMERIGSLPFRQKMGRFMSAFIIRAALIEAGGLFAGVATMLTNELYFLVVPALCVIILVLFTPGPGIVAEELRLSPEEKRLLEDPSAIVSES